MNATTRMTHPVTRDERGVTLVELAIALVLLAVGVLAAGQLMPAASRHQLQDRMATRGTEYAQEKLEQLMAVDWASTDLAAGTHPNTPEAVGPGGKWSRSWVVEQMTGDLSNLRKITVTVSWTYQGARNVQLVTYRGE